MKAIEELQVNALSEWIIGIYLHEFINVVRERVQVNPDNSRAMSALTFEYTAKKSSKFESAEAIV